LGTRAGAIKQKFRILLSNCPYDDGPVFSLKIDPSTFHPAPYPQSYAPMGADASVTFCIICLSRAIPPCSGPTIANTCHDTNTNQVMCPHLVGPRVVTSASSTTCHGPAGLSLMHKQSSWRGAVSHPPRAAGTAPTRGRASPSPVAHSPGGTQEASEETSRSPRRPAGAGGLPGP
jgi:hypothetical protein